MTSKGLTAKRGKNSLFLLAFISVLPLIFGVFPLTVKAASGVPQIISYQGRLTDSSGDLESGTFYFKFSIWDSPTSSPVTGNQIWPASSPGITTSTITSGVFNVNIGDTANGYPDALDYDFYSNQDVYLQVAVSSNGSSFETLSPRQRIAASGFAINADNVSGQLQTSSTADYTFNVQNLGSGNANLSIQGQTQIGNFAAAPGEVFVWNAATTTPQWIALGGSSGGASTDLQSAYALGNTIQTTSGRNISFTLAPAAVDSNFIINISATSTGVFQIQASSTQVLTVSQTYVTSTAALAWNIQGAATLSTTTINGLFTANTLSSAGATLSGGTINSTPIGGTNPSTATFSSATTTGAFAAQGIVTLATTSISSLAVSGTSTFSGAISLGSPLAISSGGTATSTTPQNGQLLIGNGTNYSLGTVQGSDYLGVTNGPGSITLTNLGVQAFNGATGTIAYNPFPVPYASTTGFTFNSSTYLSVASSSGTFTFANQGVQTLTGSSYLGVSSATGTVTLTNNGVQSLSGTAPIIVSSATGTPTISLSITAVSSTRAINTGTGLAGGGDLSSDRTLYFAGSFATSGLSGLQISSSSGAWTFSIATSSGTQAGFLSAADWGVFNSKVSSSTQVNTGAGLQGGGALSGNLALSLATATQQTIASAVASSTTITAGTGLAGGGDLSTNRTVYLAATFSTGTTGGVLTIASSSGAWTFNLATSTAAQNGYLSASDWLAFASKQGVTTTIAAGGSTITGPSFTLATTTSYGGGFNISGVTFNFPGRLQDINNLATTTGNL
ncbi:MAG: hypothetical protein UY23_C0004G0059, partial [Candidatus Jorgensenbacteria bacterium GW2011_GWA1_48_11]